MKYQCIENFGNNPAKAFLICWVATAVVGCSSAPSKEDQPEKGGGNETITIEKESPRATSTPAPVAAAAAKKETVVSPGALTDAFRRSDDEAMQKTASAQLSQNPNDARALHALGIVNFKRQKYLAAMYFFNKAISVQPNMADVHTNIGLTKLALDEKRDAIRSFRKAMEVNPNDGVAAANLGSLYAQEGDFGKAQQALDRAIKAGVKDSRIYNNYGISLVAMGKFEDAKELYKEATRLDPNNRDALYNLAILQIERLKDSAGGLDSINQLRFIGLADGMRERINELENKAKAGSNK